MPTTTKTGGGRGTNQHRVRGTSVAAQAAANAPSAALAAAVGDGGTAHDPLATDHEELPYGIAAGEHVIEYRELDYNNHTHPTFTARILLGQDGDWNQVAYRYNFGRGTMQRDEWVHAGTGTRRDPDGYDRDGFGELGYDRDGYARDGYDTSGRDRAGHDRHGFDHDGNHRDTGEPFGPPAPNGTRRSAVLHDGLNLRHELDRHGNLRLRGEFDHEFAVGSYGGDRHSPPEDAYAYAEITVDLHPPDGPDGHWSVAVDAREFGEVGDAEIAPSGTPHAEVFAAADKAVGRMLDDFEPDCEYDPY